VKRSAERSNVCFANVFRAYFAETPPSPCGRSLSPRRRGSKSRSDFGVGP
jgi:hypothetical protein